MKMEKHLQTEQLEPITISIIIKSAATEFNKIQKFGDRGFE